MLNVQKTTWLGFSSPCISQESFLWHYRMSRPCNDSIHVTAR